VAVVEQPNLASAGARAATAERPRTGEALTLWWVSESGSAPEGVPEFVPGLASLQAHRASVSASGLRVRVTETVTRAGAYAIVHVTADWTGYGAHLHPAILLGQHDR